MAANLKGILTKLKPWHKKKQTKKSVSKSRARRIVRFAVIGCSTLILFAVLGFGLLVFADRNDNVPTKLSGNSTPSVTAVPTAIPAQANSSVTKSGSSTTTTSGCATTSIPYGVTDENDDALATGQTQVVSKGVNGLKSSCPGKPTATIPAGNEIVEVGTGKDAAQAQALQQQAAEQSAHTATCTTLENNEPAASNAVQQDENNQTYYQNLGGAAYAQWAAKLQQDQSTYSNLVQEIGSNNCS
jgi:hypothetical protein